MVQFKCRLVQVITNQIHYYFEIPSIKYLCYIMYLKIALAYFHTGNE